MKRKGMLGTTWSRLAGSSWLLRRRGQMSSVFLYPDLTTALVSFLIYLTNIIFVDKGNANYIICYGDIDYYCVLFNKK